ncbi:hypothetical protein BDP81DRAFT_74456 [Colletotrichum phormii]|uniref:Pathway-specific nitrogen regulator n=1 Tax=Colletotrichum phormii TaxID=359342 RepID=A0AAI9ZJ65_9PEZI|nr:uncharacterized protein BDP81DRAFT_74456 [Colletotrichum phormii]KAK1625572.1 hypothetical protein BDP81DRAFT_74456 [Colletotrichum phormii]
MLRSGTKPEDLDFEIHVDQSCLTTPAHEAAEPELMDDEVPAAAAAKAEEVKTVGDIHDVEDETPAVVVEESKTEVDDVKEHDKEEDSTTAEAAAAEADDEDTPEKEAETTVEEAEEIKPAEEAASEEPEAKVEETEPASEDAHTTEEDKPEATTAEEPGTTPADSSANTDTKEIPEEEPSKLEVESEEATSEDTPGSAAVDETKLEESAPEPELEAEPEAVVEAEEPAEETTPPTEPELQIEEDKEDASLPEPEPEAEPEADAESEPEVEVEVEAEAEKEPTPATEPEPEVEEVERGRSLGPTAEITTSQLTEQVADSLNMAQTDSDETPTPAPAVEDAGEDHDEPAAVQEASRSSSSLRRASGRTEALIQAAAKEVLERLEAQTMETMRNRSHSRHDSTGSTNNGTELHYDVSTRRESYNTDSRASRRRESYNTESRASRRESYNTQSRTSRRESDAHRRPTHTEDGGDSSSQHGDSDVFSDRSPRSSLGSFDGNVDHHKDTSNRSSKRFSRMSDDVSVSEMSYYDKEDFVPTIRGAPRMPFRSPSDVRALQYSSPAPSVTGSYSPRSSKRSQVPTISRLGSPNVSAQYSPKGRKTPTRFNPKKEPAPLVLLHVTLLPLRWQWAEILEQTSSETLSPEAKTLREAWHHLHDRVADTVCERGILLSHPQDDYEILEERLLEALDLPLRRRARVLECGHYIGPSNEMTLGEDMDSDEDEYEEESRRKSALVKTHWCQTCRHEIRYESLGPGKIFRIKVYASNGLMRTGAWAACWKEMERVDVEIEPIVESAVLDELERLVIAQSQQLSLVKHDPTILESTEGRDMPEERGMSDFDRDLPDLEEPLHEESHIEETNLLEPNYIESEAHVPISSPPPAEEEIRPPSPEPMPRYDPSEERRLRDEARMREIYGHPPAPEPEHHEPASESRPASSHHDAYSARFPPPPQQQQQPEAEPQQPQYHQEQQHHQHHQSPPPPEEAYAQHHQRQQPFQNAGLGELLLEAARVFMQDKKKLAIVVMSLLVLFMAIRPAPREVKDWDGQFVDHAAPVVAEVPASQAPLMESIEAVVESVTASEVLVEVVVQPTPELDAPEVDAPEPTGEVFLSESESESESDASVEDVESTSTSATEQTSAVEQETSVTASPSSSSEEVRAPSPTPVHETITTRELVRIIETVTETVKAVVTETEVVRVQPTASVAAEEGSVEDDVAETLAAEDASETEEPSAFETVSPVEESVDEAESDMKEPATETALPVVEDVEHDIVDEQAHVDVNEETELEHMEVMDENERDEL